MVIRDPWDEWFYGENPYRKLQQLVDAAERALRKMKVEYDRRVGRDVPEDECWAEAERLDDALQPFRNENGDRFFGGRPR